MPYLRLQVIAITPPHLYCTLRAHVLYAGTTLFISSKTALRLHVAENQSRQSEQGGLALLTRALLARIEQDVAEACCLAVWEASAWHVKGLLPLPHRV